MVEESLIPSVLRMFRPPLPEWTHSTGARQADENGSACTQEIFSQDNKLLAQLLTALVSAAGSRPPPPRASRGSRRAWPLALPAQLLGASASLPDTAVQILSAQCSPCDGSSLFR